MPLLRLALVGCWARCACVALVVLGGLCGPCRAATVHVAVAANFLGTLQKIAPIFTRDTGHTMVFSAGSTGKFYAQITNGAPFEVLLSADDETPARLEAEGLGVRGSRFTYAVGRLALWSADSRLIDSRPEVLRAGKFSHLAIANPQVAPYGAAALQALDKLGLRGALQTRLILGENITQTYQFVASGNAELGFVALSQIMSDGQLGPGSVWLVPPGMHDALRQDAVLLEKGRNNPAALALMQYLRSDGARQLMRASGYAFSAP